MYIPTVNREDDPATLKAFMRANPFAMLTTMSLHGLVGTHLPIVLNDNTEGFGLLQGHVARGNSQWQNFLPDVEAMVVFTGPQHYISPNWYVGKQTHGQEVPTWNYIAVHAYGKLRAIEEPHWLLQHLAVLTDQSETISPIPWKVSDAPPGFIAKLAKAIVGFEIEITRVEGRWKASQNRTEADAVGVMEGLDHLDTKESTTMRDLVRERRPVLGQQA